MLGLEEKKQQEIKHMVTILEQIDLPDILLLARDANTLLLRQQEAEILNKKAGQEVQEMLKKIYTELVLIRKELQAIRNSMESSLKFSIDSRRVAKDISQIQVCQDSRLCRK